MQAYRSRYFRKYSKGNRAAVPVSFGVLFFYSFDCAFNDANTFPIMRNTWTLLTFQCTDMGGSFYVILYLNNKYSRCYNHFKIHSWRQQPKEYFYTFCDGWTIGSIYLYIYFCITKTRPMRYKYLYTYILL